MGKPAIDHDAPCVTEMGTEEGLALITCLPHGTRALAPLNRRSELESNFYCDKGRDWRFLVREPRETGPILYSLTTLAFEIQVHAQHNFRTLGLGLAPDMIVRRWVDDDTLESVELRHEDYEALAWLPGSPGMEVAWPTFRLVGAGGTEYLARQVELERTAQ
jgi:hypothetical protein